MLLNYIQLVTIQIHSGELVLQELPKLSVVMVHKYQYLKQQPANKINNNNIQVIIVVWIVNINENPSTLAHTYISESIRAWYKPARHK